MPHFYIFMPRIECSGTYCFCHVCLSVCLFISLSVVNFNLRYNFWTVRDKDFIFGIFGMHINDALSSDTKVNDLVTFTLTFVQKKLFELCCHRGNSVSQTHVFFPDILIYRVIKWTSEVYLDNFGRKRVAIFSDQKKNMHLQCIPCTIISIVVYFPQNIANLFTRLYHFANLKLTFYFVLF